MPRVVFLTRGVFFGCPELFFGCPESFFGRGECFGGIALAAFLDNFYAQVS